MSGAPPADRVEAVRSCLLTQRYVAGRAPAMGMHLALTLHRPRLVEGVAGASRSVRPSRRGRRRA